MKSQKCVQGDKLKQRFSTWVRELLEGVRKMSNFTDKFPFGGTPGMANLFHKWAKYGPKKFSRPKF
jgi:hypothetical protein